MLLQFTLAGGAAAVPLQAVFYLKKSATETTSSIWVRPLLAEVTRHVSLSS